LCGNGIDATATPHRRSFPTLGLPLRRRRRLHRFASTSARATAPAPSAGAWRARPTQKSTGAADCADVIDNDCDGLVDAADPDCAAAYEDLGAYCSLPYLQRAARQRLHRRPHHQVRCGRTASSRPS